jgi:hypothetical protein
MKTDQGISVNVEISNEELAGLISGYVDSRGIYRDISEPARVFARLQSKSKLVESILEQETESISASIQQQFHEILVRDLKYVADAIEHSPPLRNTLYAATRAR